MTTVEWTTTTSLGESAQRRFVDALPYCAGTADAVSCGFTDGVPSVKVDVADGTDAATVRARLDRMVAQAARIPDRQQQPVHESGAPTGASSRPDTQFREVGPGVVVGSPLVATAMAAVDEWALRRPWLAAQPIAVPGMVTLETLERANYVRSFPHHLTTCSVVEPRWEAIERLNAAGLAAVPSVDYRRTPLAVTPAVCHNVYAYLAGTRHTADATYSVRGSCARHEPSGYAPGRRMWSFSMREFVFVGSAGSAHAYVDTALRELCAAMAATGLPVRVIRANDPFFVARAAAPTVFQIAADSKFEVVGLLPDGGELAIASINLHRQHFGDAFGIVDDDGVPVHSACVAFGLERWAYWLLGHLAPADVAALADRLAAGTALHDPRTTT